MTETLQVETQTANFVLLPTHKFILLSVAVSREEAVENPYHTSAIQACTVPEVQNELIETGFITLEGSDGFVPYLTAKGQDVVNEMLNCNDTKPVFVEPKAPNHFKALSDNRLEKLANGCALELHRRMKSSGKYFYKATNSTFIRGIKQLFVEMPI